MPRQSTRVVRNECDVRQAKSDGVHCVEFRVPHVPNLVLRCQPGGQKSWSLRFCLPQERKWHAKSLGRYPAVNLDQAKKEAQRLTVAARAGNDPRTRLTKAMTFREMATAYLAERERDSTSRWPIERARIIHKNVLPEIGDRGAEVVTKSDVSRCVEKVSRRGARRMADLTLGAIRSAYSWACDKGLMDADPTRGIKKRNGVRHRERVLNDDELRAVWHRLDQPSPLSAGIRVALKLQILLGVRIGEATSAARSDFDLVKKVWTIPRTKNGHEHRLPLSDVAVQILKEEMARSASRWLCPSPHDDGPIRPKSASRAVLRLQRQWSKEASNVFRTHDFRRSCATRLGEAGVSDAVIDRILNHRPTSITGIHYNHAVMWAAMREALDAWSTEVTKILGVKTGPAALLRSAA